MIGIVIAVILIASVVDTIIGNKVLPGKVQVVNRGGGYYVSKVHRVFFVPAKWWVEYRWVDLDSYDRSFHDFCSYGRVPSYFTKSEAIKVAQLFSNRLKKEPEHTEIVWSNRRRQSTVVEDDLLSQFSKALEDRNGAEIERLGQELGKQLKR